jgi:YVTN family beta-propeller protein
MMTLVPLATHVKTSPGTVNLRQISPASIRVGIADASCRHAHQLKGIALLLTLLSLIFCQAARSQSVVATVPIGSGAQAADVDTVTNTIYVANAYSNNVTVIDGATNTVAATLTSSPGPRAVLAVPSTNTIYVVNNGTANGPEVVTPGNLLVINGSNNTTSTIALPLLARCIAYNPNTNLLYVGTSDNNNNNNLVVIDAATTSTVATIPLPQDPIQVVVNSTTNTIYVDANSFGNGSNQANLLAIDGATNTITTTLTLNRGSQPMALNETTNTLYLVNSNPTPNGYSVVVFDGATNTIAATLPWSGEPNAIAVNPVTNTVYVGTNNTSTGAVSLVVMDGSTNNIKATVNASNSMAELLVNTTTNTVYQASSPTVVLNGATNEVTSVAVGSGATAGVLNLTTNYIYVINANDSTLSVINGAVTGPAFSASPSVVAFGNQTQGTTSSAKTLTVTNSGTTSLSFTNVAEAGTNMADFVIGSDSCNGTTLAVGKTCTVSITFEPSTAAAELATLTFTDNAADSPEVVNLTGTGTAPVATASTTTLSASATSIAAGASVTLTATVAPASGTPTPTGTVTFKDGSTTLGTGALNSSGVAAYSTSALGIGTHSVTASYGGDGRNLASVSSVVSVSVVTSSTTTTLTASSASAVVGSSDTFTATVAGSSGGATPTGTVTFNDGTTALGTATLNSSGVSTFSTSSLAAGTHSITASYAGDANNAGSASAALAITVWPGPPGFTLALSPASGTFHAGKPVTTTITLTSVNGFNAATNLTCGSLPKNSKCVFSSSSVTPGSAGTATSTLTIDTDVSTTSSVDPVARGGAQHPTSRRPLELAGTAGLLLLLPVIVGPGRRLRRSFLPLCAFACLGVLTAMGIASCGGPTTPHGSYSVQITGTAGSTSQTATFDLTIN